MDFAPPGWTPFPEEEFEVEPAWEALAAALVARFRPLAPDAFSVRAARNGIEFEWVHHRGAAMHYLKLNPEDEVEDPATLERTCDGALSYFQDLVAEETTEPWPAHEGTLPLPGVEVGERQVRLWYGDQKDPVLELDPISREELR